VAAVSSAAPDDGFEPPVRRAGRLALNRPVGCRVHEPPAGPPPLWDGRASVRIADAVERWLTSTFPDSTGLPRWVVRRQRQIVIVGSMSMRISWFDP